MLVASLMWIALKGITIPDDLHGLVNWRDPSSHRLTDEHRHSSLGK